MRVPSLVLSACLVLANKALSAPGDLDTSFATDQFYKGQFEIIVNADEYSMTSVALQPDGKIVAAAAGSIIRLLPDGTLDPGFNSTGVIASANHPYRQNWGEVRIQSDGKVVACSRGAWAQGYGPSMRRWNPDGTPDTSFNGNGVVLLPAGPRNLSVDDTGRILVSMDNSLARFTTAGQLDSTFGESGFALRSVSPNLSWPGSIGVMTNREIVLPKGNGWGTLTKLTADGGEDPAFPELQVATGYNNNRCNVEVEGSNLTYYTGRSLSTIDRTGAVLSAIGGGDVSLASYGLRGFTMQRDGKPIIVGNVPSSSSLTDISISRLLITGAPDPSFAGGGTKVIDYGNVVSFATRAVVQRDGKIVVGAIRDASLVVMRLLGDDPDLTVEHPKGTNLEAVPEPVIDFGPVVAGQSGTRTIHLSNRTPADLNGLTVVKGTGGTPGEFSVVTVVPETLAAGESVELTVNMTPSLPGQKSATLVIQSNDPDENPFTLSLVGRQATATDLWRQTHFGSMDGTGIAADLSDPDADGIPNLMEFALGANPREPTPAPGTLTRNGITLEFTYWRSKAALGEVAFVREFSQSLADGWSQIGGMVESIVEETTELQKVLVTTPAGTAGRRFVRLRVTRR